MNPPPRPPDTAAGAREVPGKAQSVDELRYGIFLRPDPATCWAVTQVTGALRAQYGLVSAAAFPPHATLVGNLRTTAGEAELAGAVGAVLSTVRPIQVFNSGVQAMHEYGSTTYRYNIDLDEHAQMPNQALREVARRVKGAVLPLVAPAEHLYSTRVADYAYAGHLGLASHDLLIRPHLADEVGDFLTGLPLEPPVTFTARWYSLYRLQSPNWDGHWWKGMTWDHLTSWEVVSPDARPAVCPGPVPTEQPSRA